MNKIIYILLIFITSHTFGQVSNHVKEIFTPEDSFIYTYPNIELPISIDISQNKLDSFSKLKTEIHIKYFLSDNKEGLKQGLNRWKVHQNKLNKNKLKKQPYTYLSLALSANNPNFIGKYNKKGVYQLSFPLAAKYGLRMDSDIDERKGRKAEKAIAKYLIDLEANNKSIDTILINLFNSKAAVKRAKKRANSFLFSEYYNYLPETSRDIYFVNKALEIIVEKINFNASKNETKNEIERVSIPRNINLLAFEKVTNNEISLVKNPYFL